MVKDLTVGSVPFVGTDYQLSSDTALTYDATNGKLSVGNLHVSSDVTIDGHVTATIATLGNITINANTNTIGTITGNLDLNPYGLVQISNAYTLPGTDGATGYYLQTDGMGTVSWAQSSSSLNIAGDGSTSAAINLLTDTLTFVGSNGITAEVSGSNVNFTLSLASDTQQGIASFDATNFTVTAGNVVSNAFTIGNTSLNLGGTTLSLTGLDSVEIDHIKINQNEITYIGTGTGDISIQPLGTGTVAVNNARITGLADPVGPYDAATRNYVDGKVTGLTWKQPVNVLGNTQTSFTGIWPFSIDSHTIQDGYRVLLISQTIATQDGIYTVSTSSGMYSLTRSEDALAYTDLVGAAIFVEEGTRYGNTGWVQSNTYLTDFNNQEWYQFAGAGAYTAGAGLLQDGTTFSVDVNDLTGGLEISANKLQIQHTIAGDGLTYTDGVINVGGTTDRITVTASAVDIASTYAGQRSITTVGTLTNATWQGDTISTSYGGTGLTTFNQGDILVGTTGSLKALAIGLSGQVLQVNSDGSDLVYADLDGGTY